MNTHICGILLMKKKYHLMHFFFFNQSVSFVITPFVQIQFHTGATLV